jgi:hypothetical protein
MKKIAFYITASGTFGYRPNKFDWQVGETINTQDGKEKCQIIKVTTDADSHLIFMGKIIAKLNKMWSIPRDSKVSWVLSNLNKLPNA